TKVTGRQRSQSLQPEPHARSSEREPEPAILRKQKDRKPEINGQVAADQPIVAPAHPEVLNLSNAPASPLEPSFKADPAVLDLPDALASQLELSAEAHPEIRSARCAGFAPGAQSQGCQVGE